MVTGDRPSVPNVAIIVTDGQSNNPALTAAEAKKARAKGITILALGVGHGSKKSELNEMATDPDSSHVYTADNFDALASLQAFVSNKACEGTVYQSVLSVKYQEKGTCQKSKSADRSAHLCSLSS